VATSVSDSARIPSAPFLRHRRRRIRGRGDNGRLARTQISGHKGLRAQNLKFSKQEGEK
jgi:hypothetical protein